jgi:hypothetical protein
MVGGHFTFCVCPASAAAVVVEPVDSDCCGHSETQESKSCCGDSECARNALEVPDHEVGTMPTVSAPVTPLIETAGSSRESVAPALELGSSFSRQYSRPFLVTSNSLLCVFTQ